MVPEDYFDTLAERTMAAIRESDAGDGDTGRTDAGRGDAGRTDADKPGELQSTVSPEVRTGRAVSPEVQTGRAVSPEVRTGRTVSPEVRTGKPGRVVNLRPFLALAAAILGFAILAAAMVRLVGADRHGSTDEVGTSLYAELAAEDIDMYMLENELNMTETAGPEMTEETIPTEAIIEYLMTEDFDLNEIYELL